MMRTISGFHAIEEILRSLTGEKSSVECRIFFSKSGPRIKKILALAAQKKVPVEMLGEKPFLQMLKSAKIGEDDARGILLQCDGLPKEAESGIALEEFLREAKGKTRSLAVILDSVTDPRNVGAILRSAAQFGCDLAILPSRGGAKDGETVARSSAGAAAFVRIAVEPNLASAVAALQDCGFWVYAACADGEPLEKIRFAEKCAIVMGSEGSGISRLVKQKSDSVVSISTTQKIDSLNVSVAAGILLHAVYSQFLQI